MHLHHHRVGERLSLIKLNIFKVRFSGRVKLVILKKPLVRLFKKPLHNLSLNIFAKSRLYDGKGRLAGSETRNADLSL